MKCCMCSKEVDVTKNDIPPKWFGLYDGWKLVQVICAECIHKPEYREEWLKCQLSPGK